MLSVRLQSSRIKKKFQDPSEKSQKSHMKGRNTSGVGLFNYSPRSQQALEYRLKFLREKNSFWLTVHLARWTGKQAWVKTFLDRHDLSKCAPPPMDFPRKCAAINPRIQMKREDGMPRDPGKGDPKQKSTENSQDSTEKQPPISRWDTLTQTVRPPAGNEPDRWAGWLDLMRSNSNRGFVILLYCLKTLQ